MTSSTCFSILGLLWVTYYVATSNGKARGLKMGFYRHTCPQAESIVRRTVSNALKADSNLAAPLIKMHFHDCFVWGCDASILIDSTSGNKAEKESPANFPRLCGFEVIDEAKRNIELKCPQVVSCSDILAFAARESVLKVSLHLITTGIKSKLTCRPADTPDPTAPLEAITATGLDNRYYTQLYRKRGLLTSDQTLLTTPSTRSMVNSNMKYPSIWRNKFGEAMARMGDIGVMTGSQGEIRKSCRIVT